MIYRARTEANEVFITMYETEEPKIENYREFVDAAHGVEHFPDFKKDYEQWQSSKREYRVRDEDKEEIRDLIWKSTNEDMLFEDNLEKGIDCTFLKNRLELRFNCINQTMKIYSYSPMKKCKMCDCKQQWTLLPLEDKKENEAKYTKEQMIFIIRKMLEDEKIQYHYVREWLDENLHTLDLNTFTRKQNIQEPE